MNLIKEPMLSTHNHFIIEITLILQKTQKKIIISLFISDTIKVKELKEFISKDFDFPINSITFFIPFKGILDDSFEFKFEPDKKINLNLILNDFLENVEDLNNKVIFKKPIIQNNINDNKKIKNEINNSVSNSASFFSISNDLQKLDNFKDNKNESNIYKSLNMSNIKLNIFNNNQNEIINKNECEKTNNQIKNDKCNFILSKTNEIQRDKVLPLLNKKRFSTTFKTTKLNKDNQEIKQKKSLNSSKKNIKVINFNINKKICINNYNEFQKDIIS